MDLTKWQEGMFGFWIFKGKVGKSYWGGEKVCG